MWIENIKELPHNYWAEVALLFLFWWYDATRDYIADKLSPSDFYRRENAQIYSRMRTLYESGDDIDFVSMLWLWDAIDNYFSDTIALSDYVVSIWRHKELVEDILDCSIRRKTISEKNKKS